MEYERAKVCTKCGKEKLLEEFHKHRRGKDGHRSYCKECRRGEYQSRREAMSIWGKEYRSRPEIKEHQREYSREYYQKNIESIKAKIKAHQSGLEWKEYRQRYAREYYQKNAEAVKAKVNVYRNANREAINQRKREWAAAHPRRVHENPKRTGRCRKPWVAETKLCGKCGKEKPLEEFDKQASKKSGRRSHCKVCRRADYQANRQVRLEYMREYMASAEYKEHKRKYDQEYHQNNPKVSRRARCVRRARKNSSYERMTVLEIRETLVNKCFFCGASEDLAIAHDIPIGPHGPTTKANTLCLCRSCNSRMGRKTLGDILQQLELLV